MTENRVIITANNQINQDIRVKGETMKADTAAWLCRKAKPKHGNWLAFIDLLINSVWGSFVIRMFILCHIENTRYKTHARSTVLSFCLSANERTYDDDLVRDLGGRTSSASHVH